MTTNKMPTSNANLRFFLKTVLGVGATLFGLKLLAGGLILLSPPAATLVPARAKAPLPSTAPIDRLLPVPDGFIPVAKVISNDAHDVPKRSPFPRFVRQLFNTRQRFYTRRLVVISLPAGLPKGEIDANLRAVARKVFENGAMSVHVEVHSIIHAGHPANLMFAPHGQWHRVDRVYKLDEYKAVITHAAPFDKDDR